MQKRQPVVLFYLFVIVFGLIQCTGRGPQQAEVAALDSAVNESPVQAVDDRYQILPGRLGRLTIGDFKLAEASAAFPEMEVDTLFPYPMLLQFNPRAYRFTRNDSIQFDLVLKNGNYDQDTIEYIVVHSQRFMTPDGIKTGMTVGELLKMDSTFVVEMDPMLKACEWISDINREVEYEFDAEEHRIGNYKSEEEWEGAGQSRPVHNLGAPIKRIIIRRSN